MCSILIGLIYNNANWKYSFGYEWCCVSTNMAISSLFQVIKSILVVHILNMFIYFNLYIYMFNQPHNCNSTYNQ